MKPLLFEISDISRLTACLFLLLFASAVSKNPDGDCNPFLGEDDPLGILIGVGFTVVSLGYAGWSCTADKALNGERYVFLFRVPLGPAAALIALTYRLVILQRNGGRK